jgi:AcrR family transcriptional regulator
MSFDTQNRVSRSPLDLAAGLTRSTILAAATQVFAREGIAAARVEDILVEADIARRTFYRYFASKEAVLAALYELWTGELLSAIEAARRAKPDDPLAGIRAGIDLFIAFFQGGQGGRGGGRARKGVARAVRELVELAMRSDSLLAPRRRWMRSEIVRILDESVRALDRRRLDPLVFHGLLGALEGIALELDGADDSEVERARRVLHGFVDQQLGLKR